MLIGNRIPKEYFIVSGTGESDKAIHCGSFDIALKKAGIHNYNLIVYSSIIPKNALRIDPPKKYVHGSVCEVITAECSAEKGNRATAGMIIGWIYDGNKRVGGMVAEYPGLFKYEAKRFENPEKVGVRLKENMKEMFRIRCAGTNFKLRDVEVVGIESLIPKKKYGTALVALCFTSYEYPVLGGD